jgi:large subunit ribosomal protein L13
MIKATSMLSREEALDQRRWFVIDAKDRVLGRVASSAAQLLRGKGKASFTPHVDCGDFVVIVNAACVRLTGAKKENKTYYWHTGHPGGIRNRRASELLDKHPDRVIRSAVEGMLPKNRLGRQLATKLKIYAGPDHPHEAQQPSMISLGGGTDA